MILIPLVKDEVANTTYIKICQNKTRMGPISEEKVARARANVLNAAANKVRITAGFAVKVNTDDNKEEKTNSQNKSYVLQDLGDNSPMAVAKHAVLFMQAWDNVIQGEGSSSYVEKLAKALEARATAYRKLGINPASGEKPDLSADQRVVYNSIVGPTGFDYYEYHLAFKLEGQKKFIRSKTYRSLRPMDMTKLLGILGNEVDSLSNKITITSRQIN